MKTMNSIKSFFKSRFNSFQKVLTVLGCIIGIPLSILLVLTGIAAVPFTGGASLLPAWLAMALFLVIVTGSFASAGKYIGLAVDTIINKEKLTNEKIATIAGCTIGAALSILAFPLHFAGVRFIVEKAAIATWELLVYLVPLTIGAFGSACSYIGRSIDTVTEQKTIFDLFRKKSPPRDDVAEEKPLLPLVTSTIIHQELAKNPASVKLKPIVVQRHRQKKPLRKRAGFFDNRFRGQERICYNSPLSERFKITGKK